MIALEGTAFAKMTKEIKTYMPFSLPVDPANVRTLVDLDLSYALASTLVAWTATREPVSSLAESWEITDEKKIKFTLSKKARWSDGTKLTSEEVINSLNRANKVHGDSLKGLFDLIEKIEAGDSQTIIFKLKVPAANSGLVRKLTEPMYGVVSLKKDGSLNLTKTTGPFVLDSTSNLEIKLKSNKHWISPSEGLADFVIIRRPPQGEELQESFLQDSWANLVGASSLVPETLNGKYKKAKYAIWNRNLDKVFFLAPSLRLGNEEGRKLLAYISDKIQRNTVTKSLSGFNLAQQFFPQGYVLFDNDFKRKQTNQILPAVFHKKPLVVLGADSRICLTLRQNLKDALKEITGTDPILKIVSLSEFEKNRVEGDYDLLAGALPVNDPNIEGAIGFFFGLTPPIIPNAGEGTKNFQERIEKVKVLADSSARNLEYRKIFSEATQEASVIPLFHFSTTVMAKDNIDLSSVPTTDETVAFSKVKFK